MGAHLTSWWAIDVNIFLCLPHRLHVADRSPYWRTIMQTVATAYVNVFDCELVLHFHSNICIQPFDIVHFTHSGISPKSVPSDGGRSGPPSHTWFIGPTWVCSQTSTFAVQPFLQGTPVCPTHTHRPRYVKAGVTIGRIYAIHTIRPNDKSRLVKYSLWCCSAYSCKKFFCFFSIKSFTVLKNQCILLFKSIYMLRRLIIVNHPK